tara:strand:+ start:8944 stop:9489 length:546 start_codon:yes stop_codon:yes gene_type:complete
MKEDYEVSEISLEDAESLIQQEHYLEGVHGKTLPWTGHKCYGLFYKNKLVGAVQYCSYDFGSIDNPIFHERHFGCYTEDCKGFWEIARLAVASLDEHNITSWFLSRTLKMIDAKCVVSVADDRMHQGTIYAATNFEYYGLQKDRVLGLEDYEFHVYAKSYDKDLVIDFSEKEKSLLSNKIT